MYGITTPPLPNGKEAYVDQYTPDICWFMISAGDGTCLLNTKYLWLCLCQEEIQVFMFWLRCWSNCTPHVSLHDMIWAWGAVGKALYLGATSVSSSHFLWCCWRHPLLISDAWVLKGSRYWPPRHLPPGLLPPGLLSPFFFAFEVVCPLGFLPPTLICKTYILP